MPARAARKGKKKVGGRTVALVKAAFENDSPGAGGGEFDTAGKLSPREAEEKLAQMVAEMKEKGAREAHSTCVPIMMKGRVVANPEMDEVGRVLK